MAAKEEMYHQDLGPVMSTRGLSIAEGNGANILSTGYRLGAVAARRSDDGTWYAAQVFGRKS